MRRWPLFPLIFLAVFVSSARAHEVRPTFLHVQQISDHNFAVLWKVPARGDAVLKLALKFPDGCSQSTPRKIVRDTASVVQHWQMRCEDEIAGRRIIVQGLETTAVEMIGQIDWLERSPQSVRLTGGENAFDLSTRATWASVASSYGSFGFTHIWEGWDHLLFLTALMLLVRSLRQILWAVTSFTIAHSITLALAVLQIVHVPSGLVETLIAFSIVFVAAEAMRRGSGVKTLAMERPWLVSFAFGLLHGLGFAGALTEAGLPPDAIGPALLFFNLGVEAGQIVFVLAFLALLTVFSAFVPSREAAARSAILYVAGIAGAFWTFERAHSLFVPIGA